MLTAVIGVFCFSLGLLLQKLPKRTSTAVSKWINKYLFYLVLPALALLHIPPMELSWSVLMPISAAWFTFMLSWVIFGTLGKYFHWDRTLTGCLIIVSGLANTSFMGFPVLEFLYGPEALPTALLIDQAGSFLLVSSMSIVVASIYGTGSSKPKLILLKIISFPPFFMLLASLTMSVFKVSVPDLLLPVLEVIGKTMAPVALIAIGIKLQFDLPSLKSRYFWLGMSYRTILAPALVLLIYSETMEPESLEFKVTVLESGMAPMITGSLVAIEYQLNPKLASQLAGIGLPISLATVLLWHFFLRI